MTPPYLLSGTDDWALSEDEALELLGCLEDSGVQTDGESVSALYIEAVFNLSNSQ